MVGGVVYWRRDLPLGSLPWGGDEVWLVGCVLSSPGSRSPALSVCHLSSAPEGREKDGLQVVGKVIWEGDDITKRSGLWVEVTTTTDAIGERFHASGRTTSVAYRWRLYRDGEEVPNCQGIYYCVDQYPGTAYGSEVTPDRSQNDILSVLLTHMNRIARLEKRCKKPDKRANTVITAIVQILLSVAIFIQRLAVLCKATVPIPVARLKLSRTSAFARVLGYRIESLLQLPDVWNGIMQANLHSCDWTISLRFYNYLILAGIDSLLGIAAAVLIYYNTSHIMVYLCNGKGCHNQIFNTIANNMAAGVSWLMQNPAGIKLNEELCTFLGTLFLYLLDSWEVILYRIFPTLLPWLIRFTALSGFLGLTVMLSFLWDTVAILFLHVYYLYTITSRLYAIQLDIMLSLWRLFTGKKRNVLRERIDTYTYDVYQLILGTLLFTLMGFLLPTTFLFYLYFTFSRLCLVSLYIVVDLVIQFLLHFPLYSLWRRHLIRGEITIQVADTSKELFGQPTKEDLVACITLQQHAIRAGTILAHELGPAMTHIWTNCKPAGMHLFEPIRLLAHLLKPPLRPWAAFLAPNHASK